MRLRLSHVVALALVWAAVCAASEAAAQERSPAAAPQQGAPARTPPRGEAQDASAADAADLAITARVTAAELLFRKVPNPRVEFTGRPRRETVWEADRHNLPAEVRPGVTYRDIGITLRITSVFADIDRIVAEALGEVPLSDDAPPQEQPRQTAPPEPQAAPPATAAAAHDNQTVNAGGARAVNASSPTPKTRGASRPRRGRGR